MSSDTDKNEGKKTLNRMSVWCELDGTSLYNHPFLQKVLNVIFKEAQNENEQLCLFNYRCYELTWRNVSKLDYFGGLGVQRKGDLEKVITLSEGELSSSDATISWVDISGFHWRTEHFLRFESEKLFNSSKLINPNHRLYQKRSWKCISNSSNYYN